MARVQLHVAGRVVTIYGRPPSPEGRDKHERIFGPPRPAPREPDLKEIDKIVKKVYGEYHPVIADILSRPPNPFARAGFPPIIDTSTVTPTWVECPDGCGEYWCNKHGQHVHDCVCPPLEEWIGTGYDPYLGKIDGE